LTAEHIIPQSIGGRLKPRLYCKDCNSAFGTVLDKEISDQFGHIATTLQIRRERGTVQPFTVQDIETKTELLFDGRQLKRKDPIINLKFGPDGSVTSVDVTARTESDLNRIMQGLRTRYGLTGNGRKFQDPHSGPTDTTHTRLFNTALIGRAVTKMGYGFLCYKLPTLTLSSALDEARHYIQTGQGRDLACVNFLDTRFMVDNVRPLHKIHITFDRAAHLIVGFVSIFGIFRYTVLLSKEYRAELELADVDYTYNPVTQRLVEGNANFIAPRLREDKILSPREPLDMARRELIAALRVLESYVSNQVLLDIELQKSQPSN